MSVCVVMKLLKTAYFYVHLLAIISRTCLLLILIKEPEALRDLMELAVPVRLLLALLR
jgi:hypothetical protein